MNKIIDLQKYRRTCENCKYWVPAEKNGIVIIKDSCCGYPEGWTQRFIGGHLYARIECNEFERKEGLGL